MWQCFFVNLALCVKHRSANLWWLVHNYLLYRWKASKWIWHVRSFSWGSRLINGDRLYRRFLHSNNVCGHCGTRFSRLASIIIHRLGLRLIKFLLNLRSCMLVRFGVRKMFLRSLGVLNLPLWQAHKKRFWDFWNVSWAYRPTLLLLPFFVCLALRHLFNIRFSVCTHWLLLCAIIVRSCFSRMWRLNAKLAFALHMYSWRKKCVF